MTDKKNKVTESKKVKVFITDRAQLFTEADLAKYEIPQSKQLVKTDYGTEVIPPPYNLEQLMFWQEMSVAHSACIRTKVQDAIGIGWKIKRKVGPEGENASEQDEETLKTFFNRVNGTEDLTSVLKKIDFDFEGNGNGYFEITRNLDGLVGGIYHVPSQTVRLHKTKEKYVQVIDQAKVWFKKFGDVRALNKETGEFGEVANPLMAANELIPIRQYTWRSAYYGAPDWLSALFPMFGEQKEKDYNLQFFQNFGIPAYAVILEGSEFDAEIEETIKKYFDAELKQSNHKTMVLTTPAGTKILFEKLNVDPKEASFRVYRRDNRDDILTAHRVPPYRAGIVISGQLGGSVASEIDRIYLTSVIDPKQQQYEWIINNLIIKEGLQINGWEVIMNDILIDERKITADINAIYFGIGAKTANEIREELGAEPYEGGDIFYISGTPTGLDMDTESLASNLSNSDNDNNEDTQIEERTDSSPKSFIKVGELNKARRSGVDVKITRVENKFDKDLSKEFRRQGRELMDFLETKRAELEADAKEKHPELYAEKKKSDGFYEDVVAKVSKSDLDSIDRIIDGWEKSVKPQNVQPLTEKYMKMAGKLGGEKGLKEIYKNKPGGSALSFDLNNPHILKAITERGTKITGSITKKTLDDFRQSLAKNLYEEPNGWAGVKKDINVLFKQTYRNRSETIARTETGIAVEEVKRETYKRNTGEGTKKRWIAQNDSLTRDTHREANGTTILLEDKFKVGDYEMAGPHDPSAGPEEVINCRCDMDILPVKVSSVEDAWTGE